MKYVTLPVINPTTPHKLSRQIKKRNEIGFVCDLQRELSLQVKKKKIDSPNLSLQIKKDNLICCDNVCTA